MMDMDWHRVDPKEIQRRGLKIQDVASYAMAHGWKPKPDPLDINLLFEGPLDLEQQPIVLALPKRDDLQSAPVHLSAALTTLAAVEHRPVEELFNELVPDPSQCAEVTSRDRKPQERYTKHRFMEPLIGAAGILIGILISFPNLYSLSMSQRQFNRALQMGRQATLEARRSASLSDLEEARDKLQDAIEILNQIPDSVPIATSADTLAQDFEFNVDVIDEVLSKSSPLPCTMSLLGECTDLESKLQ